MVKLIGYVNEGGQSQKTHTIWDGSRMIDGLDQILDYFHGKKKDRL